MFSPMCTWAWEVVVVMACFIAMYMDKKLVKHKLSCSKIQNLPSPSKAGFTYSSLATSRKIHR